MQVSTRKDHPKQMDLWSEEAGPNTDANPQYLDRLLDVRDGLTREQRLILYVLYEAEKERPGRKVPTLMLYGRVCEHIPISKERFMALLAHLVGRGVPGL